MSDWGDWGWGSTTKRSRRSKTAVYDARARAAAAKEAAKEAHKGASVTGFLGNFVDDVIDTGKGLPAGIVHVATQNPVDTVKEVVDQEKHTWSPLFTGDYNKFLHQFYENPLGPMLDVASVLTGGAGAAAKGARLAAKGSKVDKLLNETGRHITVTENTGKYGTAARNRQLEAGAGVSKLAHSNPFIRMRQQAFHQASIRLPSNWVFVGESARAARALHKLREVPKGSQHADAYIEAAHKVNSQPVRTAYVSFLTPKRPTEHLKWLREVNDGVVDPVMEKALSDPKANRYFDEALTAYRELKPHGIDTHGFDHALKRRGSRGLTREAKNILRARDRAMRAADMDASIAGLPADKVLRRRYMHTLLHDGVRSYPSVRLARIDSLTPKSGEIREHLGIIVGEPKSGMSAGKVEVKLLSSKGPGRKTVAMNPKDVREIHDPVERERAINERYPGEVPFIDREFWHPSGENVSSVISRIKGDLDKRGLPEPVYFPDKMMADERRRTFARSPKGTPSIRNLKTEGTLYMAGVVNHDPHVLSRKLTADLLTSYHMDLANALREQAEVWTHPGAPPQGYVFLDPAKLTREFIRDHRDVWAAEMESAGTADAMTRAFKDRLTHRVPADGGAGHRLIVSQRLVDTLMKENRKGSQFFEAVFHKPTRVWKHMVLGMRPTAFLTNNVVGNSMMYALEHAGPRGVEALLHARSENRTFRDLFPERALSFGDLHKIDTENPVLKGFNKVAYSPSAAHEQFLRKSVMVNAARGVPEIRKLEKKYKAQQKANREKFLTDHDGKTPLHLAIEQINSDPKHAGVMQHIGDRIDDTMGNYRRFSKAEDTIRDVVPFYAWDRHAARWYYKMLTQHPIRSDVMTELGRMGAEDTDEALGHVPEFMESYLPEELLGFDLPGPHHKGTSKVLNTSVLNPLASVAELAGAGHALFSGKPAAGTTSDIASQLNPLIAGTAEHFTGRNLLTGAPVKDNFLSDHGLIGNVLGNTINNTPIVRLASSRLGLDQPDPNDPSTYMTPTGRPKKEREPTLVSDTRSLLDNFLGYPVKHVNMEAAREWRKTIDSKEQKFHPAKKRKRKKRVQKNVWGW